MVIPLATEPTTAFYLNWTFWSFVVAFTALVLSQLPKVNLWFKRKKIAFEMHDRITVNHWLGMPSISIFLGISNKGRSTLKIKKIELKIFREKANVANLESTSFFETSTSQVANLFFSFDLPSESTWNHSCWFSNSLDRNKEQKVRSIISEIDKNIAEKAKANSTLGVYLEADEHLVKELIDHKEKYFIWEPGEYYVEILIKSEPKISFKKNIRFTLYESDTNELNTYSSDYKFGMHYHNQKNKGINIPISDDSTHYTKS